MNDGQELDRQLGLPIRSLIPDTEQDLPEDEEDSSPTCILCEEAILKNQEKIPYQDGEVHFWCYNNKEAFQTIDNIDEVQQYVSRRGRNGSIKSGTFTQIPKRNTGRETKRNTSSTSGRTRKYKTETAPGAPTGVEIIRKPGGLQRYRYPEGVTTRAEQRAYRRRMEAEGRLDEIRIAPPRPDFGIRRDGTSKAVPSVTLHVEDQGKPKGGNPTKVLSRRKKMSTVQTFDQSNKPLSIEEATEYLKNWDRDHYSGPSEEIGSEPLPDAPGIITTLKKWWNKIRGL